MSSETSVNTDRDESVASRSRLYETLESASHTQFVGALAVILNPFLAVPFMLNSYLVQVLFTVFLFIGLAFGWNFMSGFTGYVDFGYAGFVGFGAYLTVITIVDFGFPWPLALLTAMVVTVVGTGLSLPMLRLRGGVLRHRDARCRHRSAAVRFEQLHAPDYPRRQRHFVFPRIGAQGPVLPRDGVVLVLGYLTYRIANSPFGLRLLAIRDDETLAASLGSKTVREKGHRHAVVTRAVAGLIGGILAFNLSYIDPTSVFNIQYTEFPIVMVLFGGLGTVLGPVIGGFIFVILYEILWSTFPQAYQFLFGIAIIGIVLFMPEGIIEYLKENDRIPRWRSI